MAKKQTLDEAREFAWLVKQERKRGEKLEAVFLRVKRRDPRRWGARAKWWRLWRLAKQTPAPTLEQRILHSLQKAKEVFDLLRELEQLVNTLSATPITTAHEAQRRLKVLESWALTKGLIKKKLAKGLIKK